MDRREHIDLAALEQAIRGQLEHERGVRAWLRSRSRPARLAMALGFAALVGVAMLLFAHRGDLPTYPQARMLLELAWFVAGTGAAAWLALRPIYLPRPSGGVVAAVAAFALAGPIVAALLPEVPTSAYHRAYHSWRALGCFGIGTATSLLAFVLARALDRGGTHGAGQLVLAAAAAGLVGNVALQLHCPINYPGHLLLGHATVPLGLVLGALGARLLKVTNGAGPRAR
jgi:hypothetical protein